MEKLIVGIDLCDTYTQAAVLGREEAWVLPTVICRKREAEEWSVGRGRVQIYADGRGSNRRQAFEPGGEGGNLHHRLRSARLEWNF